MWNKISNIANEAIVAAKDIKHHIEEVTNDDLQVEETIENTGNEHFENLAKENSELKLKLQELTSSFNAEKKHFTHENQKLSETVKILEAALAEKDKESLWEAEEYQQEIQEVLKSKNKVQRELEKVTGELLSVNNTINKSNFLLDEVEKLKNQVKKMQAEKNELVEEKEEWKKRYENYTRADEDKVSRSFFIQFVSGYSRNIYNPQERMIMINSLVSVLHLTGEEKNALSFEDEEKEEGPGGDGSLFDKFNKFLSGFSA